MFKKYKEKFIGDREFYANLIRLIIPMIVQQGITSFVSLLDNVMVGRLGTESMSGVAIVNQLLFVFNLTIFGGLAGASIFVAQFYGKGDHKGVRYALRFKLIFSVLMKVRARRIGDKVNLRVIDNGDGMTREELEALRKRIADRNSRSIGLTNLDRRLRLRYPEERGLRICSIKNLGTSVSFCIPYKKYTPDAPQTGKTE